MSKSWSINVSLSKPMGSLFVLTLAISTLLSSQVQAQAISIPVPGKRNIIQKPAQDLYDEAKARVLDVGEASSLAESGQDISLFNPVENKMWQQKKLPTSNASEQLYPQATTGVKFISIEAATRYTILARVQSNENPSLFFRLAISRLTQPMMMRAALLRKLGYDLPSPQLYKNLKVSFSTTEEQKAFLTEAEQNVGDFESRKWVQNLDQINKTLVLASSSLEVVTPDAFDLQWGLAPNPDFPNQLPLVQRFSRNRAYRALILPYALVDVPESVNRFSGQFGMINSGHVVISYPMASSFAACTFADAQWLLRKLQALTNDDFNQIVSEAGYPIEIQKLVLAKLMRRASDALKLFKMQVPGSWAQPSLIQSSSNGLVKNGKVTKEFVDGYPQRFAHGERTSPYQEGDFGRYLKVEALNSGLQNILDRINERLQVQTVGGLAQQYQQETIQKILNHIRTNPMQPLYQQVTSWGGPIGGLNLSASRHVATGTYYGSTAAVQLVDNISASAGLGYFRAIDGLQYLPSMGGNISISRDYTHVRPILSLKEGSQVTWKNLMVPSFMKKITQVLKNQTVKKDDGTEQNSLDAFLSELRDGEVFTVTDSIGLSAYLQVSASIDNLLGLTPFSFMNSVTLGADTSKIILRQTQFIKTQSGIQVFVREMKNKAAGAELNANFFLNVFKLRTQLTKADIQSAVYVIDYSSEAVANIEDATAPKAKALLETRDKLRASLIPLLQENDTELLDAKFKNKKFIVEHEFKTIETKANFLAYRMANFTEEHLMRLQYPRSEDHPELDPKDEEITLFGYKRGQLIGRDLLGFIFDAINGILNFNQVQGSIAKQMTSNPANVPFGKAKWRIINSEVDISKKVGQYPSMAQIQHVWGGWKASKPQFLKIIDEIENEFHDSGLTSYPIINRDAFVNMKSLDFYRITQNLSVLSSGVQKLRDLLLQPSTGGKTVPCANGKLKRFFQRAQGACGDNVRVSDAEMLDDLILMMGNGSYSQGQYRYTEQCQIENGQSPNSDSGPSRPAEYWVGGRSYACLSGWVNTLLKLAREFPSQDKKAQAKWVSRVLQILDDKIPLPQLLQYLGEENYVFLVRVNGFRVGDEDGDLEYFSSTAGDPAEEIDYANGLFQLYAKKTRILPSEIDRTQGGFQ